jgi:aminoglycoside phosphotransferase (APT) family kinase protein
VEKGDITVDLVRRLLGEQFPEWAGLPVRPVALDGWDNTTFRLGDEMSVRIPSHDVYVVQVDKEHRWLPELASHLPVEIPRPIAKGQPGCGLPRPWSVYGWIDGEPALIGSGAVDAEALADDLGAFLVALREVPADGGPAAGDASFQRGGPVSVWDEQTRSAVAALGPSIDAAGAIAAWDAAIGARPAAADRWVHGDVTGANLVVRDGRLAGVIDFGCCAVGDPACDLVAAWTMFEGRSRRRFAEAVGYGPDTWARARGWALWRALVSIEGQHVSSARRDGSRFGWRGSADDVLADVLADPIC